MNGKFRLESALTNPIPALKAISCCSVILGMSLVAVGAHGQQIQNSVYQIQNQSEPGSGFFVEVGNKVFFVTAKHVLGNSGESVFIDLPNDTRLEIPLKNQVPLSDIDAAILIFDSMNSQIVALPVSDQNPLDNEPLTVWGFPVSDESSNSYLTSREGTYMGNPLVIKDGYSLLYSSSTQIGFSGGPIINKAGEVVGMHGRSESKVGSNGESVRTGNALGIPIISILSPVIDKKSDTSQINEEELKRQSALASMKNVSEIMAGNNLSDQILNELKRAEDGKIPKQCIEIARAYYYLFFSSVPDLTKAKSSLSINKRTKGVDPAYYALGSLVSRKSGDFKSSLVYNRILEKTGNSEFLQYSERKLKSKVKSAVEACSE